VLSVPIGEKETSEAEFSFEDSLRKMLVLAGISLVDAVVAAHDDTYASLDSIIERPEIKFVQGLVVQVGRHCLATYAK
jgi:hypothetical protein